MQEFRTLDITIQDLPQEVTLDLSDAGGETLLENAIDSLKSEVLYNLRFDDVAAQGRINVDVLNHQGSTFSLRLTFTRLVA